MPLIRGTQQPSTHVDRTSFISMSFLVPDQTYVSFKEIQTQLFSAASSSWLAIGVGYSMGYSSSLFMSLTEAHNSEPSRSSNVTIPEIVWMISTMPLGGAGGGIMAAPLLICFGRKVSLGISYILSLMSLFLLSETNIASCFASRFIDGLGVGITTAVLPIYISEISQVEVRGFLTTMPTIFGNFGILLGVVLGTLISWKWLIYVKLMLYLPFIFFYYYLPETPRWYLLNEKMERARRSLVYLRSRDTDTDDEFDDMVRNNCVRRERFRIRRISKEVYMKPLMLMLGLFFFQQMTLINILIFFGYLAFKIEYNLNHGGVISSSAALINLLSSLIVLLKVDSSGRKFLLYISSCLLSTIMLILIVLKIFQMHSYITKEHIGDASEWIYLVLICLFVFSFSMGFGPLPWLLMGEVFPGKFRSIASSIISAFHWLLTFLILIVSFYSIRSKSLVYLSVSFMVMLVSIFFIKFFITETKFTTLERIERILRGKSDVIQSIADLPDDD